MNGWLYDNKGNAWPFYISAACYGLLAISSLVGGLTGKYDSKLI